MDFKVKSPVERALLGCLLTAAVAFVARPTFATTIGWNNTSGGNWSDATNWNPNQVPGAVDTALITNTTGTFTVTVDTNAAVSGLTVGGGASGVQSLKIASGSTLSVGGALNTAGNGPVTLAPGGVLNLASTFNLFSGLTNAGTVNMTNTFVSVFNFSNPAAQGGIINQVGGLIDFRGDANILPAFGGGEGFFINQGMLRKSLGFTSTINLSNFDNSMGSVDTESGTLVLEKFQGTLAGTFNAAAGTLVQFSGGTSAMPLTPGTPLVLGGTGQYQFPAGALLLPTDIIPGLVLTGGTLQLGTNFQGGAITNLVLDGIALAGTNIISGSMSVTSSTLSGTFTVTNGGVFTANTAILSGVNLSSGLTILNGGTVKVVGNGLVINYNGSSNALASLTIASGGFLGMDGFSANLHLDGPLTNSGTLNVTNNEIFINNDGSAAFQGALVNQPGGVIGLHGSGGIAGETSLPSSQVSFINQGMVIQDAFAGAGIVTLNSFSNAGTLHSTRGSLTFISVRNLMLLTSSTLSVDLDTFNHGQFVFSTGIGTLNLGGTFGASLINGFIPGFNAVFNVVTYNSFTGTFTSLNLPTNVTWVTNFGTNVFSIRTPPAPVALTVSNITANDKAYDQNTNATLVVSNAALVGVANGDSVTLNTADAAGFFTNKNAGFGLKVIVRGLAISGTDAHKYTLTQPTLTANIYPMDLTVTGVTASNKVYDGTADVAINATNTIMTGVLTNDAVVFDPGGALGTFFDQYAQTGKLVVLYGWSLTGPDAANYALPFFPVNADGSLLTADITPKPLTVLGITANNKIYDGTTSATLNTNNASLSDVISPDEVILSTNGCIATFASPNLGTNIAVTVGGLSLVGNDATNYSLIQPTGLKAAITTTDAQITLFITSTNQNAFLRGIGAPGQTYVIQFVPTLSNGPWTDLSGPLIANGTGLITYVDIAPPSPRFYRARVGP
jgi:YDG domain